MDSACGRKQSALADELFDAPYRFEFFQAVRLLEELAAERTSGNGFVRAAPLGEDGPASHEPVRFRAAPTLAFPASEIATLESGQRSELSDSEHPQSCEMSVNFFGLTGPSGVLPRHYTSMVIERSHPRHKDRTLQDFFDLFNHREICFFYRAWEKYRLAPAYERHHREQHELAPQDDAFTAVLFCLVGLGTPGLRRCLDVDDEAILYYGGLFAHRPPCAVSLRAMIADFFGVNTEVQQFRGQWLYLHAEDQSMFPTSLMRLGRNLELGTSVVAGCKVWDIEGKFRVRLGPLSFSTFSRFLPNGDCFSKVCHLVRLYVGAQFDFDVQLVLKALEVPYCQFAADATNGPRLGWNTWIRSGEFQNDVDDAVFSPVGF